MIMNEEYMEGIAKLLEEQGDSLDERLKIHLTAQLEALNKTKADNEAVAFEFPSMMTFRSEGYEKGQNDFTDGVDFLPDNDYTYDGEAYHYYREGYISGFKAAEMDADATLESQEGKVDLELFKSCEHEECKNHDDTLDNKYFIRNPLDLDNIDDTLKSHISNANPWVFETVSTYNDGTIVWGKVRISSTPRVTKEAYINEMLYNNMTPCEQVAYDSLPDVFEVYRGYAFPYEMEYQESLAAIADSWTVDKLIAEFFIEFHAKKMNGKIKTNLITATVKKSDVLFVIFNRNEAEILLFADRKAKIKSCEEKVITVTDGIYAKK